MTSPLSPEKLKGKQRCKTCGDSRDISTFLAVLLQIDIALQRGGSPRNLCGRPHSNQPVDSNPVMLQGDKDQKGADDIVGELVCQYHTSKIHDKV